jgi:hypothetical protein
MQTFRFFFFEHGCFQYPEPGLVPFYLYKVVLVVAAQDKLSEELHFPFVLSLGLQLVDFGRTQVLYTFGKLLPVEQYFVYKDEKLIVSIFYMHPLTKFQ